MEIVHFPIWISDSEAHVYRAILRCFDHHDYAQVNRVAITHIEDIYEPDRGENAILLLKHTLANEGTDRKQFKSHRSVVPLSLSEQWLPVLGSAQYFMGAVR